MFPTLYFLLAWLILYIVQNSISDNDLFLNINFVFLFLCLPFIIFLFGPIKLNFSILLTLVIALLFFYQSATSILINIDRSRSFYVLSWINKYQIGSSLNQNQFDSVRSSEKNSVVSIQKRIIEQESRGLVFKNGNVFSLTRLGKVTLGLSNYFAKLFRLQGWYQNKY